MSIEKGDGRLTPEDSENEEAKEAPVPGEGFLAAFLRRRDEELTENIESHETEEDDEEEEDEGNIFQRFRAAFSKRLKGFVSYEPLLVAEAAEEGEEETEETSEEPIEFPLESGASLSIFDSGRNEVAPEADEVAPEEAGEPAPEFEPEDREESPEETPENIAELPPFEEETSLPPEEPRSERAEAIPPLPSIETESRDAPVPPVAETRPEVPEVPSHRHKVDTAIGLGLLYEHHRVTKKAKEAEKRDKEQQAEIKELKEVQKDVAAREQEKVNFEQKIDRLESTVKQSVPEVIPAKQPEQPKVEAKMPQVEQIPSIGQIIAERAPKPTEVKETVPSQEQAKKSPERVLAIDPKELFKPDFEQKDTELLLQQIEAAAEKGVALEGQYERRHELKDVASSTNEEAVGGFGVAAPREISATPYYPEISTQKSGGSVFTKLKEQMSLEENQRAMSAGLWGGIMVVIGLIIWAVM